MFITVIVYSMISSTFGVGLSTAITVTKSDALTVISAVKSSPAVVLSVWSPAALAEIVLVITLPKVPASTVAVIFKVSVSPWFIFPMVHIPLESSYEPAVAELLIKFTPVGNSSVKETFVAFVLLILETFMV